MATCVFVTVPNPNVSVIAFKNQMVDNSLVLECNLMCMSIIREVSAGVDIMWSSS